MNTATKLLLPLSLTALLAACAQQPAADVAAAPVAAEEATVADTGVAPIAAASGTYAIDATHTLVLAKWNHMGFSNPSANFGNAEGKIVYNAEDVTQSSVEVTLPLSGLNSFTAKFDEHLHSADFFDAATFPVATFKSTKVEAAGTNKLTVTGDLTIKDKTAPVVLAVTLNGAGAHPMAGKPAIGFDATATIKRTDFGVGAYVPNISDDVQLSITTEAVAAE